MALKTFEEKAGEFARVRALIMKIVKAQPGLTVEEISKQFLLNYGFLPRIDNRLREARTLGWVESKEEEGRLHWYPRIEVL
ncbi:MAG: hypothetical protein WCS62_02390 [Bacilli bacterium]|jgi:predicted transcriptional regulator